MRNLKSANTILFLGVILFTALFIAIGYLIGSGYIVKLLASKEVHTYQNKIFGFEFNYPYNLYMISKGQNEIQNQIERGELVSGTNLPSYDTISFKDNDNEEIFNITIFPVTETEITPENFIEGNLYMSSSCDIRWTDYVARNIDLIKSNDVNILAVTIANNAGYESDQINNMKCYYFKNNYGNKIVLTVSTGHALFLKSLQSVEEHIIPSLKLINTY